MRTYSTSNQIGPAAAVLVAGVLVLATGCVEHRTYVQPTVYRPPVEVPAPPPPAPAPVETPAPPVVVVPAPTPPPPPPPPPRVYSAVALDQMLGPIALYPDPLLAQVLPAATLPGEVVVVDRFLRDGGSVQQVDAESWDHSLKALARYPATLHMMAENIAWTTELGQAFVNQPDDVMDSVQRLRGQARAMGNLVSTPQQTVVVYNGVIEILPASPQVIYVPVYQPEVVYVRPPPAPGRFHISFGAGLFVGAWLNHDCDWHHHRVIVWHHDRPRPSDWWYRAPARRETPAVVSNVTVVNNTTIVNQNFTVWHPQTHAPGQTGEHAPRVEPVRATAPAPGGQDVRQPQVNVVKTAPARGTPTTRPTSNPTATPERPNARPAPVVAEQKPVPAATVRPVPAARQVRPTQPEVQPATAPSQELRRNAPREEVKPVQSVRTAEVRPGSRDTRALPAPARTSASSAPQPAGTPAAAPRVGTPSNAAPGKAVTAAPSPRASREAAVNRGQQRQETAVNSVRGGRSAAAKPAKVKSAETNQPTTKEQN